MPFVPRHRKRRDPFGRAQLAPYVRRAHPVEEPVDSDEKALLWQRIIVLEAALTYYQTGIGIPVRVVEELDTTRDAVLPLRPADWSEQVRPLAPQCGDHE